ncbi:hypothetical protein H0H93_015294, partial [Arthromyces matolae]
MSDLRGVSDVMEWDEHSDQDRYLFCHESAISIYQEYTKVPRKKRDEWVKARHLKKRQFMDDGRRISRWLDSQSENRSAQLKNVRGRRFEAIKQRLVDLERLGWEREFDSDRTIKELPCVKISNELTDRGWEAIKSKIIKRLEPIRERLERDDRIIASSKRNLLLDERTDEIRGKYFHKKLFPKAMKWSIRSSDGIRALMNAAPFEQVEFSDSLILESADAWLKDRRLEFRSVMDASSTQAQVLHPRPLDPLSLATAIFERSAKHRWDGGPYDFHQYPELLSSITAQTDSFAFPEKLFYISKAILESSGLDPDTTTRDVVETDFYVECGECPSDAASGKRFLMTWMTSIKHAMREHREVECPRMARAHLDETELKIIKDLVIEQLKEDYSDDFECARCEISPSSFVGTPNSLMSHVKE